MTDDKKIEYCPHCGLSLEGATEQPETTEIKRAMREHFKLTPMWIDQKELQFIAWARAEGVTVEQIKLAAARWKARKAFNWKMPTLKDITTHWLALMTAENTPLENVGRRAEIIGDDDDIRV